MMTNVVAIMITGSLLFTDAGISKRQQQRSVSQPSVVQAVAPIYPAMAATLGISGRVIVEAQVNERGTVTSVRSVEGPPLLHRSAEDTARRWLFAGADDEGDLRTARLLFTFKLLPRGASPDELLTVFLPPYTVEIKARVPEINTMLISDPLAIYVPFNYEWEMENSHIRGGEPEHRVYLHFWNLPEDLRQTL